MNEDAKRLAEKTHEAARELNRTELWVALGGDAQAVAPARLIELRDTLARSRSELRAQATEETGTSAPSSEPMLAGGTLMGAGTTDLVATVRMRMDRVATSMAHLFALRGTPLVTVDVKNLRDTEKARVAVYCHVEGYSGTVVESTELDVRAEKASSWSVDLFPPFFPERIRGITELCAASLHIRVDDLDKKTELVQARSIPLMPPTTAVLGYVDPSSQTVVDQRDLLAAWITPNSPGILELLRTAADFSKLKAMLGYQVDADAVREHVRAIYMALNAAQIVYVDSRVAFGAGAGQSIQRIRLPRESLAQRSANCIDGTVLMASLLEATGIDPLIVLVPGHAYLGYRPDRSKPQTYEYVETTLIGTKSFDEASAVAMARTQRGAAVGQIKHLDVRKLREAGITPME